MLMKSNYPLHLREKVKRRRNGLIASSVIGMLLF